MVKTIPSQGKDEHTILYKAWLEPDNDLYKSKGDTIKVCFRGKTGHKAIFRIESIAAETPMREEEIGIYRGIYKIKKGDNITHPKIIIRFNQKDKKDAFDYLELKTDIIIDTTSPPQPKKVKIQRLSQGLLLTWSYPEAEDFDSFRIYRRDRSGNYTLLYKTNSRSCLLKENTEDVQSYVLTAIDKTGNESKGVEVIPRFKGNH